MNHQNQLYNQEVTTIGVDTTTTASPTVNTTNINHLPSPQAIVNEEQTGSTSPLTSKKKSPKLKVSNSSELLNQDGNTSSTTTPQLQMVKQLWEELSKKEEDLKNIIADYSRKQITVKRLNTQIKKEKERWANHINASTTGHCHELVRNKQLKATVQQLRIKLKNKLDNRIKVTKTLSK